MTSNPENLQFIDFNMCTLKDGAYVKYFIVLKCDRQTSCAKYSITKMIKYGNHKASLCKVITDCMYAKCATPKSVGLDLYSPKSVLIPAHNKVLIDMGTAFQIPMAYCG